MHYEINVSLNGKHFFGTHERSLRTLSDAETVYDELDKRFPAEEGFALQVTEMQCSGKVIMGRGRAQTIKELLGTK